VFWNRFQITMTKHEPYSRESFQSFFILKFIQLHQFRRSGSPFFKPCLLPNFDVAKAKAKNVETIYLPVWSHHDDDPTMTWYYFRSCEFSGNHFFSEFSRHKKRLKGQNSNSLINLSNEWVIIAQFWNGNNP
jgi:hypothetical protein